MKYTSSFLFMFLVSIQTLFSVNVDFENNPAQSMVEVKKMVDLVDGNKNYFEIEQQLKADVGNPFARCMRSYYHMTTGWKFLFQEDQQECIVDMLATLLESVFMAKICLEMLGGYVKYRPCAFDILKKWFFSKLQTKVFAKFNFKEIKKLALMQLKSRIKNNEINCAWPYIFCIQKNKLYVSRLQFFATSRYAYGRTERGYTTMTECCKQANFSASLENVKSWQDLRDATSQTFGIERVVDGCPFKDVIEVG